MVTQRKLSLLEEYFLMPEKLLQEVKALASVTMVRAVIPKQGLG